MKKQDKLIHNSVEKNPTELARIEAIDKAIKMLQDVREIEGGTFFVSVKTDIGYTISALTDSVHLNKVFHAIVGRYNAENKKPGEA